MLWIRMVCGIFVIPGVLGCTAPFKFQDPPIVTHDGRPSVAASLPSPLPSLPPQYAGWDSTAGFSSHSVPEIRLRNAVLNGLTIFVDERAEHAVIVQSSFFSNFQAGSDGVKEQEGGVTVLDKKSNGKGILRYRIVRVRDLDTAEGIVTWVMLAVKMSEGGGLFGKQSIDRSLLQAGRSRILKGKGLIQYSLDRPQDDRQAALLKVFEALDIPEPSITDGEPVSSFLEIAFADALFSEDDVLAGVGLGRGLMFDGRQILPVNQKIRTVRRLTPIFGSLHLNAPSEWLEKQVGLMIQKQSADIQF